MTPERWRQLTELFHAALERDAAVRPAFLAAACGDDRELEREVADLLAGHEARGLSGIAQPSPGPVFVPGMRVGAYEIVGVLGAGGMGEVYRARDTTLHRDVALKVLLPEVAADPDRIARFASEARLLAALNHPHVAQIYGFEALPSAGAGLPPVRVLVMELVDGPTLADRIARGPLALGDALAIAGQIADALEAAHERGIVHRDLKPANIKVRPDGTVKVLDFGLAKVASPAGERDAAAMTVPSLTTPGMVVGTAAYMAPEQAKGLPVDRRVDLWAFGCVLFEMLSGRRPFDDDSLAGVLTKVLTADPPWQSLPASTPTSIRALLSRCLQREPRQRLDSAAVARLEIEDAIAAIGRGPVTATPDPAVTTSVRTAGSAWLRPVLGTITFAGILAALWLNSRRGGPDVVGPPRLNNALQLTNASGVENSPTWSPDGTRLAYYASDGGYGMERRHDVWVSQLGRGDPVNLTGGTGDNLVPSWSPDGREIAFLSNREGGWAVYTMPAIGGRPRQVLPLADINAANWSAPQWSRDGKRLHVSVNQRTSDAPGSNVVLVLDLASLKTTRVQLPDHEGTVVWDLNLSPDGERYVYISGGGGQTEVTRLWTIGVSGEDPVPLTDGRTNVWSPTWSDGGRALFYVSNRGGTMDLWQQAMSEAGRAVGEPVPVTVGLGIRSAAFSPDGRRVAYSRGNWISNVWRVPILPDRPATWADATAVTSERAFVEFVDVSPDGRQLALSSDRRGNQDLWVMSVEGGEMTQLTTDPAPDWNPRWSPDGRQIVFYSARSGNRDIWVLPATGGPARQLTTNPRRESEPSWSPDGTDILFRSRGPQAAWIIPAEGGEPRKIADGFAADPIWSPDGSWVLLSRQGRLYRVARSGGAPVELQVAPPQRDFGSLRFSIDRRSLFYSVVSGALESQNLWKMSLNDGKAALLTNLQGRRGNLSYYYARSAESLYFTWREDDGDIWVMDVTSPGTSSAQR